MKALFISDEYPCFCRELEELGYRMIPTENIKCFHPPERRHADMQRLRVGEKVFSLSDCEDSVAGDYPQNVRLNCLYLGNRLYGRLDAVDAAVLRFCAENGIETVNVKQGYTRCSTLVLNGTAAITADPSIRNALAQNGAEVLLISAGHIRLPGFDSGFIGGASFTDGDTVFFFGDITKHPDHERIRAFCETHHKNIKILCQDQPLTDLGGAVKEVITE